MTAHRNLHGHMVKAILLELGADPRWRIWQNNTGVGRSLDGERMVRFGLEGSSDIIGLLKGTGTLVCLEIKIGKDVQSTQQKAFEAMVKEMGGAYAVVRSVKDARKFLESQWEDR